MESENRLLCERLLFWTETSRAPSGTGTGLYSTA
jgi:hypothetical protein